MTNERHPWTKEDRMLLCTILKNMKFRYPTYNTREEYTKIGRWHTELYEKVSQIMSITSGKDFSVDQIRMQMYKVNMHKQLKEGKNLTESQFEMLKCMLETDLLDRESFYNMHYGWHEKYMQIVEEEEIIKKADEIKRSRQILEM